MENANEHISRSAAILQIPSEHEALNLNEFDATSHRNTTSGVAPKHHGVIETAWRRHISMSVPSKQCRDHLANERTALGYIRSAEAFAVLGVIISQLLRLSHVSDPSTTFGFFVVSVPLAAICHVMALIVTVLGCYRFLHWQAEISRGYAISSGWEMLLVFVLAILVSRSILFASTH